jgi:hypothetical protein
MRVFSKNTKNSFVHKFQNIWIPLCESAINNNSDILKRRFIHDVILKELDSEYEVNINVTSRKLNLCYDIHSYFWRLYIHVQHTWSEDICHETYASFQHRRRQFYERKKLIVFREDTYMLGKETNRHMGKTEDGRTKCRFYADNALTLHSADVSLRISVRTLDFVVVFLNTSRQNEDLVILIGHNRFLSNPP